MAQWNIGIDEHGNFNSIEPENDSFVCAVVTKVKDSEIERSLQETYRFLNGKLSSTRENLLSFFHGMDHNKETRKSMVRKLREINPEIIDKIVVTYGRPYVVSNAQQWWLMGVQSLLYKIINSNLIDEQDEIRISIATRGLEYIGFYPPDKVLESKTEETEGNRYLDLLRQYHNLLQTDIERWLKSKFTNTISVKCISASISALVTLADQATNMAYLIKEELPEDILEEIPCQGSLPDDDCTLLLASGDVLGATSLFLENYFVKQKTDFCLLVNDIFDSVDKLGTNSLKEQVWEKIIEACRSALDNRGKDGLAENRVSHLKRELKKEIESRGIPSKMRLKYYGMLSSLYAHSGNVKLEKFEQMEHEIVNSKDFCKSSERWQSYLNLQLFKVQALFNTYNFDVSFLDKIIETERGIAKSVNDFVGLSGNEVDDDIAALIGTKGQAAAFRGEYDKALEYFFEDYNGTSDRWKSQVASYIFVVYHRQENWEKACEWFEKQAGESLESFTKSISSSSDQWIVLNYLRLYALGLKLKKKLPVFPYFKNFLRTGDYPYGLLLKWMGICFYYLNKRDFAKKEFGLACSRLFMKSNYTINSLALPVLKIWYALADYGEDDEIAKKYKDLFEKCCASESFATFASGKSVFELKSKSDIWETAMMLPFNYA